MVRTTIPAAMTKTCPAQRWKRSATASAKQVKRAAEAAAMPGLSETYTSACATPEAILSARAAPLGVMAQTAILFSETVVKVLVIKP